jgi:hypothetical protein
MSNEFTQPIQKREWLDEGLKSAIKTFEMVLNGTIPEAIQAWMIVTSCLRVMRAIYGSDLETVVALRSRVLNKEERVAAIEKEISESGEVSI